MAMLPANPTTQPPNKHVIFFYHKWYEWQLFELSQLMIQVDSTTEYQVILYVKSIYQKVYW